MDNAFKVVIIPLIILLIIHNCYLHEINNLQQEKLDAVAKMSLTASKLLLAIVREAEQDAQIRTLKNKIFSDLEKEGFPIRGLPFDSNSAKKAVLPPGLKTEIQ